MSSRTCPDNGRSLGVAGSGKRDRALAVLPRAGPTIDQHLELLLQAIDLFAARHRLRRNERPFHSL